MGSSGGLGWARLAGRRVAPHPYKEALVALDESLVQLLAEREKVGGDAPGVPDPGRLKALTEAHQLDPMLLAEVFRVLDSRPWRQVPRPLRAILSTEDLVSRGVVPIMQEVVFGNARCIITHAIQFGEASEVHMEVTTEPLDEPVSLRVALDLQVEGPQPYESVRWRSGGGGRRHETHFLVTPELPRDLQGIRFLLTPAAPEEQRPRIIDVTVDSPVPFVSSQETEP